MKDHLEELARTEYLTSRDIARLLKISRALAYVLMSTRLPVVKIGKTVRVPAQAFRAWLAEQTVPAPEESR